MPSASYNGTQIASSDDTVYLEGNHYFPRDSVKSGFLVPSTTKYTCPWKGAATYYSGQIDGQTVNDVAWSYESPKQAASNIKDYVAFDKHQVTLTNGNKKNFFQKMVTMMK